MIEFVQGNESHTSNWGKFYVRGLEAVAVKEDHESNIRDGHHSYQCHVANEVPAGTVFTIFEQDGNKRGTDTFIFKICVAGGETQKHKSVYGSGFVEGQFTVIAQATGKTKSPRLMRWWDERPAGGDLLAYARHCAAHIDKRGVDVLPSMEGS